MLASLFGFRGRIGRVRYILSLLALGPALLFVFAVLLFGFGFHPGDRATMVWPVVLALLAVVPLWLWTSLSLQACRIRDIGLDPTVCITTWFGLNFVMGLVNRTVGIAQIGEAHPVHPMLVVQGLIGLVFSVALLVWPGHRGDGGLEARWEEAFPPEPEPQPQPVAAPARVAAPYRPATGTPSFGRRGL